MNLYGEFTENVRIVSTHLNQYHLLVLRERSEDLQ